MALRAFRTLMALRPLVSFPFPALSALSCLSQTPPPLRGPPCSARPPSAISTTPPNLPCRRGGVLRGGRGWMASQGWGVCRPANYTKQATPAPPNLPCRRGGVLGSATQSAGKYLLITNYYLLIRKAYHPRAGQSRQARWMGMGAFRGLRRVREWRHSGG